MGFAHHEKDHRICKSASHYVLSKRNAEFQFTRAPFPLGYILGLSECEGSGWIEFLKRDSEEANNSWGL